MTQNIEILTLVTMSGLGTARQSSLSLKTGLLHVVSSWPPAPGMADYQPLPLVLVGLQQLRAGLAMAGAKIKSMGENGGIIS